MIPKRSKVSDRKRFSIITSDMDHCYICGRDRHHLHEVFHGPSRQVSKDWGMVVPLCWRCHNRIHNSQGEDEELKKTAQRIFEGEYGHDQFMAVFHKNYL